VTAADATLTVDPEFASLLTPLTPQEQGLLAASLAAEGCRDPLVVWQGHGVILDGHARWKILQANPTISFTVAEVEFATREQAREFVLLRQLSRRNLPPLAAKYYRGSVYNGAKKTPGARTDKATADGKRKWASDEVAARFQVDESTVRRDARLARDLDAVAAHLGHDFRTEVLCGRSRLTRVDITKLAGMYSAEKKRQYIAAKKAKWEEARLARRERAKAAKLAKAHASGATTGKTGKAGDRSATASTPKAPARQPVVAPRVSEPAPYPPGAPATQPAVTRSVITRPASAGDVNEDDDATGTAPLPEPDADAELREDDATGTALPGEGGPDEALLDELYDLWLKADDVTKLAFLSRPYVQAVLRREDEIEAASAKAGVLA